jgi:release factor H-coupled RctB family protein
MNSVLETNVRLFASSRAWIEGEAVRQFYRTAALPGMRFAAAFPDLHPGRRTPVGAAFVTETIIYPHVLGGDIGCGMALFKTDLARPGTKRLNGWAELQFGLEHRWDGSVPDYLAEYGLESTPYDRALGTIGGGNHFAELQAVESVVDATAFRRLGLTWDKLVLLVHSGSRGLGEAILRNYAKEHRDTGVPADSCAGEKYFRSHDQAVRWARANRALIAKRFAATLDAAVECVWDGCHNSITPHSSLRSAWIHRKGAVEARDRPVVIPGTRGSFSYLVKPQGDGEDRAWSLAHGAGRKWSRSAGRLRMRERFAARELTQTPLGGRVVCEERDLLYEEAPPTYKNIEAVIRDLVDAGLVSVIATFRPLLTYKTRKLGR